MILRENGEVKIESEPNDDSALPSLKVALVTRCALNVQVKEEKNNKMTSFIFIVTSKINYIAWLLTGEVTLK